MLVFLGLQEEQDRTALTPHTPTIGGKQRFREPEPRNHFPFHPSTFMQCFILAKCKCFHLELVGLVPPRRIPLLAIRLLPPITLLHVLWLEICPDALLGLC